MISSLRLARHFTQARRGKVHHALLGIGQHVGDLGRQAFMVPHFIGPKFLTAIHNMVRCPVVEGAAMFSPAVLCDLVDGGGPALDLLRRRSPRPPAAANLCSSLVGEQGLSEAILEQAVQHLLQQLALGT